MSIEGISNWRQLFNNRYLEDGPWDSWELYKRNYHIEKTNLIEQFSQLQAPKFLPELSILDHQLATANTVIEQMNGKAILADEVGLGKTIEAGLILKEYMIRGLVKKALILSPASLINQWVEELNRKFYIPAYPYKRKTNAEQFDVIVMSLDTAKKSPHKEAIYAQDFDMIIIDEAHKLKNHKTKAYEFVESLKKKFCLLLTATPIQNNIFEIFYLVSLLKPGHLGSYETFKKSQFDHYYLKELVNQVMIRNRKTNTSLQWTNRHIHTMPIQFTKKEQEVYEMLAQLKTNAFTKTTLLKEMCSSKEAAYLTLHRLEEEHDEIIDKMQKLDINSKAEKALEIIQSVKDKVIIFTEFRATQNYLQWFFHQHGITSVPFNGKFSKSKKDWMKQLFKEKADVLIATEAGGEGINLQFCQHVINYDLPWNPMKLEQRIGRVHRLGQEGDVHIYNLAIQNTIEDRILSLLEDKLSIFEQVVGELDDILASRS